MRSSTMATCGAMLVSVLVLGSSPAVAADNLGNVLCEHGWDRILGTWVDADTNGARKEITCAWRFKNQVIEASSQEGDKKSIVIMGHNSKKGETVVLPEPITIKMIRVKEKRGGK